MRLPNLFTVLIACSILTSCYYHNIERLPPGVIKPLPGSWDKLSDFEGAPRTNAVSFTIGNDAYVGTGYNGFAKLYFNDFWKFDPSIDVWKRIPDFPGAARHSAVAFVLNGKAYVGTGTADGITGLRDFYEYDPTSGVNGSWRRVADLDSTRYGAVAFRVKNRAFVGTGTSSKSRLASSNFWEYDQVKDVWTKRPDFIGQPRLHAFAMTINDMAYVGGGVTIETTDPLPPAEQYPSDFYVFAVDDLTKPSPWFRLNVTAFNNIPVRSASSTTFSIGNFGYIMDGSPAPFAVYGGTWRYDPSENNWALYFSYVGNVPVAGKGRQGAVGFTIGNFGYVACGGGPGGNAFDDVWKFDPDGVEPDHK